MQNVVIVGIEPSSTIARRDGIRIVITRVYPSGLGRLSVPGEMRYRITRDGIGDAVHHIGRRMTKTAKTDVIVRKGRFDGLHGRVGE